MTLARAATRSLQRHTERVERSCGLLVGQVALDRPCRSLIAVPVLWDGVADEGPRSLVVVSILLLGAGLAASLVPVRRALAIQPAAAMKSE